MNAGLDRLISPQELAGRWGKTETAIRLASAVGVGPRFIKTGGQIMYAMEEVQKFERACLFFDPSEVALQTVH